jgi:uncharacterized protein (DUF58 family)
MRTGSGAERASSAAGKVGSLRARSLAALFPRIEAQRAWLDRHLTPAGHWLAVAGLVAALFGLDINRTLCWQFAALALSWLLLALLLARLRRVPVTLARSPRLELRAGSPSAMRVELRSRASRSLHGLSLAEAPAGHALPLATFLALYRRLAGTPPRWVSAELAWTCFRQALAEARGHQQQQHDLPPLAAGETQEVLLAFTALRRGEFTLPGLFLLADEPLGLARAVRRIEAPVEVLSLPAALPVARWRLEAAAPGARAARRASRRQAEEEFRALRAYRPGDPRRSIHWRASARRGELVVRETSGGEAPRAQLALACQHAPGAEAAFEAAVQVAAACLEQRPPDPARPTLLLVRGREVQAVPAGSARGVEAQLRALARCEAAGEEGEAGEEEVGLKADLQTDLQGDLQADLQGDLQGEAGAIIEALAARLEPGAGAEWVFTLPLAAHELHRLDQLCRLHEGLRLFLVGEAVQAGTQPPRARWLRPSRLTADWQAGGAAWP